jgi:tetratricopeptide (TPR) repeat protein
MSLAQNRPLRVLISFVVCIGLGALLVPVSRWGAQIQYWRVEQGLAQQPIKESLSDIPVEELTGIVVGALMAGFRSQAANFCWWKSQEYWEEDGHWPRVLPMMKAACALDPYFPEFWEVTAWHESYNLAAEYENRDLPIRRYVDMGLETLHKGLSYNPEATQLYEQLGWTYRDKLGDLDSALQCARQATMVYHKRPDDDKQTYILQPRFAAHLLESLGREDEALSQYSELMLSYPYDGVAIGASFTIRDRYLAAERALRAGDPATGEELVRLHLADDPTDALGLHLLAECRAAYGDPWGALAAWEAAAAIWRDPYAQKRYVKCLNDTRRRELQLGGVWIDQLLLSRRVEDWCLQPRRLADGSVATGMGVQLRFIPVGETEERALRSEETIQPGDTIVAKPDVLPSVADPNRLTVVFYMHGREVARDTQAPYSFVITDGMLAHSLENAAINQFVKVEMFVPSEIVPRFDLRSVKSGVATTPGLGAPPPSAGGEPQAAPQGSPGAGSQGAPPQGPAPPKGAEEHGRAAPRPTI